MDKNEKKTLILSIMGVLLLVVAVVGVSYALWSGTFDGSKENSITTGYISFTYTEGTTNVINLTNAIPMTDESGKALSGSTNQFDFTVTGTFAGVSAIDYEVYLTPDAANTLPEDYVKIYLTDSSNAAMTGYDEATVPTYSDLAASTVSGSKTAFIDQLTTTGATKNLRLRAWVSSDYNMPTEAKTFKFKVNVKASA